MTLTQLNIPRPLTVAVTAVLPLVEEFREVDSGRLMIRLGTPRAGEWRGGIDEMKFDEILSAMNAYKKWDGVTAWVDAHEYTHMAGPEVVKTKVQISNSVSVTHVTTQRLSVLGLRLFNHGLARVSVHVDTPVNARSMPETVTPSMVSVKKRKTFHKAPWEFTASRTWKGTSRSATEIAQSSGDTQYDIEIEFVPDAGYWEVGRHTSTYVAASMLMKMVNVVSPETMSVEPIPK
jgi:hypothetical protein